MRQALEIAIDYMNERLEDHDAKYKRHPATEAERINILADIETVKEALAQPAVAEQHKQEPVAWLYPEGLKALQDFKCWTAYPTKHDDCNIPLYTTPPQRTWVGLKDVDRQEAFESMPDMLDGFLKKWGWLHFSKAIEAKLKEKNT